MARTRDLAGDDFGRLQVERLRAPETRNKWWYQDYLNNEARRTALAQAIQTSRDLNNDEDVNRKFQEIYNCANKANLSPLMAEMGLGDREELVNYIFGRIETSKMTSNYPALWMYISRNP